MERWSPVAFLAAAALFVIPMVLYGIGTVTGRTNLVSPVVIWVLLLVVFVGLLGLYPRLAAVDPTLARAGLGVLTVTAGLIVGTLTLLSVPAGPTLGKPHLVAIVTSVAVGSTLTLAAFGAASLRTAVHRRLVGRGLLLLAGANAAMLLAMAVYGDPTPPWVGLVVSAVFAVSLAGIGYVQLTDHTPLAGAATGDATTS